MTEFIIDTIIGSYLVFGGFMAGLYYKDFEIGFSGKYKNLKMVAITYLTIWLAGLIVLWWSLKTVYFHIKKAL